jgi:hypothetical protein
VSLVWDVATQPITLPSLHTKPTVVYITTALFPRRSKGPAVQNTIVFYAGLSITIIGFLVWIIRPSHPSRTSKIKAFGIELSSPIPSFVAMGIGIVMMLLSLYFPAPAPVKHVACTGEHEANCPGTHDLFFECSYIPSDEQIARNACQRAKFTFSRRTTASGNRCGYALIDITCYP